jgi:ubiquitin conjugation factor E4 B
MCHLMRDPVILPSSRAVVDRSTIKSHLLSDAKDPFNRVPLTIEEVTPGGFRHQKESERLLNVLFRH